MKKVYAVGVMQLDTSEGARRVMKDSRLWHLFAHFENAHNAVLQNRGDMFERYYNYALIEETYVIDPEDPPLSGEFSGMPKEWWYYADFSQTSANNSDPIITAIEKPKCLSNVVYFWVG